MSDAAQYHNLFHNNVCKFKLLQILLLLEKPTALSLACCKFLETIQISVQCQGGGAPICPCNQGCPPTTSCQPNVGCCPTSQPAQQCIILLLWKLNAYTFSLLASIQVIVQCQGGGQPVCPCNQGCPPQTQCQQNVGCCPVSQPAQQCNLLQMLQCRFCHILYFLLTFSKHSN